MPEIEVDIEIYCAKCGAGICNNATAGRTKKRGYPYFEVEPCQACLDRAYSEGYEEGEKGLPI